MNKTPLDHRGIALEYPVIVLSCATIKFAAEGCGVEHNDVNGDDGTTVTLPDSWWTALNVFMNNTTMAREALQKVLK